MESKFYKPTGFVSCVFVSIRNILRKAEKTFLLLTLLLVVYFSGHTQSTLSFSQLSTDYVRPGAGAESWIGQFTMNLPGPPPDLYWRFHWGSDFQPGSSSRTTYDFTIFDAQIQSAIRNGQKFSFDIMERCGGCGVDSKPGVNGAGLFYPQWLHSAMQGESVKDWISNGDWMPNWNSSNYINGWKELNQAVNNHIMNGSYMGVQYKNVIRYIGAGGYGDYGEWTNNVFNGPAGTTATAASLKAIIDGTVQSYPTFQIVSLMATFDGNQLNNTMIPPEVGYYALTTSNQHGKLGYRRESWGDPGSYNDSWSTSNPTTYNGLNFGTAISNIYKYAPVVGEPLDLGVTNNYSDLMRQFTNAHVNSCGNGNFDGVQNNATAVNNFAAAIKASGYRLTLTGGNINGNAVTLNWQNNGLSPTYEDWTVTFELRSGGNVIYSQNSSFLPKLFLGTSSVTDNLTGSGTGDLYLIIRDPNGYRKPLPLGITGRNSDGSYLLKSNVTLGAGVPANKPPVAKAGSDQNITLPVNSVTIDGSGSSDPDGTISSYLWAKLSGPTQLTIVNASSASTVVNNLAAGVYSFQLKVTDNAGAVGMDTINVTVNAAAVVNQPPVAKAGSDLSITLPVNSVTIDGSGSSDPDGTISSYLWTKLSGPTQFTIVNGSSASTVVNNLAAGVYSFQLKVTDNAGAVGMDTINVTVNAAAVVVNQPPIAKAGSDQNITLPVNSVTIDASGSSDPDGTISSYLWTKLSGPTQFTIVNGSSASTVVNNLAAGVYSFQLKVTDNAGAIGMDTIKVMVNAAAVVVNQPPIAKAGSDQNITLPVNSVTIDASGSSDPDGTISSYLWTKLSGPTQFTIVNGSSAGTVVNNLVAGVYSFQLKVTDNGGAIAQDTVKIIVNAAALNQPPVANAGADMAITLPVSTVNVNGAASMDPDGTISSYGWSQVSGPSQATIATGASASTGISGLQRGVYVFSLKVTDNAGATDMDSLTVTVYKAVNKPPNANAGSSKNIVLPTNTTTLDATLSSDPDGTITAYNWTQVSGPSSTTTLTGANTAVVTVTNLVAGQYTYQLTVTDNDGATASAAVKITVSNPGSPIANAGADQSITLPTSSVTLDASGSSAPSGGTLASYVWTEKSGPSTVSLSNTVQNTLNNLQAGVYSFLLTVTDNNGATDKDSVNITVIPVVNQPPVADAGLSQSLTLPGNATSLDGSKSYDPDGTISTYSWTRVSGPNMPATTGASAAVVNLSGLVAGTYTYQLTVTDNKGASSSGQVKVIVTPAANMAPVANAGANQSITAPASSVTLNGSASSDPDGRIVSYNWVTVSGPGSITISNSNTATPSVVGLQAGGYIFELTVTDNSGAQAKDQVSVTVIPQAIQPNQPPVANAGNNQTITAPVSSVSLNGSSSFDPDGTISAFSWKQISGPSASAIAGGNTSTATASQLVAGQYIFELSVTDNNGLKNTDQVTVSVNAAASKVNLPPVADAGGSDTLDLPNNSYTLNATRSTDPDGTIGSYQWQQISGPNQVKSSNMNVPQVAISDFEPGEYEFQVVVTDNEGATSTATMKLTVEPGTGIADRFIVFPNPAHDMTTARITSSVTGSVKIYVYDMNGRQVLVSEVEKSDDVVYKALNISPLASGIYSIQIVIGNKKTMITKFVKN